MALCSALLLSGFAVHATALFSGHLPERDLGSAPEAYVDQFLHKFPADELPKSWRQEREGETTTATSLSAVVCHIAELYDLGINCDAIEEQPMDHVVRVTFDVLGEPAEMVFKKGCVDVAEAYMNFRDLQHPEYKRTSFKQRVINFFSHASWVDPLDSQRCSVVSWAVPETERSTYMRVNCTSGYDCTTSSVFADGIWFTEMSNIELHTTYDGKQVGLMVERLSQAFDYRTAKIPDGHEPVFRAADLPGSSVADYVNQYMPRKLLDNLMKIRDLLLDGAADPVSLWPWPPMPHQDVPRVIDDFHVEVAPKVKRNSYIERTCSKCPVLKTVCDTLSATTDPNTNEIVVKYKWTPDMYHEDEMRFTAACGPLWQHIVDVADDSTTIKEFVGKMYANADLLKELSSGQCSMTKALFAHPLYHVRGACQTAAMYNVYGHESAGAPNCWKMDAKPSGETTLQLSNFMLDFVLLESNHTTGAAEAATYPDPVVSMLFEKQMLGFNVKTATVDTSESQVDLKINVKPEGDNRVWDENPAIRDEILTWDGVLETCIRGTLEYFEGKGSPFVKAKSDRIDDERQVGDDTKKQRPDIPDAREIHEALVLFITGERLD